MSTIERVVLVAFGLLWFVALTLNIDLVPLYLEEPRRALVALEMMFSGNYIVPTQYGEFYYHKPPFFNWVLILLYKLSGSYGEAIPRAVTVVSYAGMGVMLFAWVNHHFERRTALFATVTFLVAADLLFYFSMFGEIDMFYSLISMASILAVHHFYVSDRNLLLYSIPWLLAGLGFMTKGFPSPIFVGASFLAMAISRKDYKLLLPWKHLPGILISFLIVFSYFYAYSTYNDVGKYLSGLWGQSSDRAIWSAEILEFILHLFRFPIESLLNVMPASLFLVYWFNKKRAKEILSVPFFRDAALLLLINALVYWISPGTRARYVYMLYPFLVLLLTAAYLRYRASLPSITRATEIIMGLLIFLAAAATPYLYISPHTKNLPGITGTILLLAMILIFMVYAFIKLKPARYLIFLCALLVGRIGFDLIVLPARAKTGVPFEQKQIGQKILEQSTDKKLWLYQFKNHGWFPLASAYYIERERQEVLKLNYERNCEDNYITFDWESREHPFRSVYHFEWREFKYELGQFTDCPSEE